MQQIILILVVIALIIVLVKAQSRALQIRNIMFALTVLSSITIYFIGYSAEPISENAETIGVLLRSIQSTTRNMVMIPDYRGISESLNNPVYYWAFVTMNAMAVFVFALSAVTLLARRYYGWFRIISRFWSESYIFTSLNDESILLAKDILRENSKALVIFIGEKVKKGDMTLFNRIESFDGVYIEQRSGATNPLAHWLLRRHAMYNFTHLLLLDDEDNKNLNDAISLLDSLSDEELLAAKNHVQLYLRIDSQEILQTFREYQNCSGRKLQYVTFSDAELVAFDVVMQHPPVDQILIDSSKGVAKENYEVMIVGFDRKGQAILRKMIEFGQFVGSTFKATIVDKDAEHKEGSFEARYPSLESNYNINFVQTTVGSRQFFNLLKTEIGALKQIVVALGSDALNISTAIEIHKLLTSLGYENVDILTVVSYYNSYKYMDESLEFKSIRCVGVQKNVFTEDKIIKGAISRQARTINEFYRRNNPLKPEWESLPYIKKESNISVAIHVYTKLKLLGLTLNEIANYDTEDVFEEFLKADFERFENLARTEHLRWNASYFTRGWQQWNLAVIPSTHVDGQDHHLKLHCCLVDWAQLCEVDKFMKYKEGTYHNFDFGNIVNLQTLAKQGLIE